MSLKHALLGFLNYGPATGYELKKFFDASVGHVWNAELSQIYPTLKGMESDGLVEMKVEVQEDRPNRKVYQITHGGRNELLEWLAKPAEPEQIREPILVKVFFGASLPREEVIRVLREHIDELRREMAHVKLACSMGQKFAQAVGLKCDAFFWSLTGEAGIKYCQASIDWAEETIGKIEQLDDSFFEAQRPEGSGDYWKAKMDIRSATEIMEKLKTAMPADAFASAHRAGVEKEDD